MKLSAWFLGGLGAAGLAGLAFLGVGLLQPGQLSEVENAGGVGKPLLAEAKKKAEVIRQAREKAAEVAKGLTGLKGSEGEHRVFVSAQLVYLPENAEPVQPLDPKMVTEDGIGVGWKIQHGFDPAGPEVKDEDPDGDGFNNLEEFLAKTDPTRKEDSPAKESKLKSRSGEPVAMALSFPEKSGGIYAIRFQVGTKRREFKGKPEDTFWVMAGPEGVEIYRQEEKKKMEETRAKAKEAGLNSHVIPLKFVSYEEKVEKVKDAKAGGVEVEVDNSVVLLERMDAVTGRQKLVFSTPQRPQVLVWDVGEIRFYTPVAGGTELGPFRVGEIFSFEGKEFAVVGREGKKIRLQHRSDPDKGKDFWVPPEATAPSAP
jgi:hypothetical protein